MRLNIPLNKYCSCETISYGKSFLNHYRIVPVSEEMQLNGTVKICAKAIDGFHYVDHVSICVEQDGTAITDFRCTCNRITGQNLFCEHCAALVLSYEEKSVSMADLSAEMPEPVDMAQVTEMQASESLSGPEWDSVSTDELISADEPAFTDEPVPIDFSHEEKDAAPNFIAEPSTMKILFGTEKDSGKPVFWYPNDTNQIFHTNTGIIGTMGSGKTQFTKSIITQLYRQQKNNFDGTPLGILIFDYKGDYNETKTDFISATNAAVLKPNRLPFNPFAIKGLKRKPLLPLHTANAFMAVIAQIYRLGPKQSSSLQHCIRDAYERQGIISSDEKTWNRMAPTFDMVYEIYMENKDIGKNDSLYAAMEKLYSFEIFENHPAKTKSLFDLLQGVVVIDLSGYDPDIQNLIVAITLELFYAQMQSTGSSRMNHQYRQLSKLILVDEADNFMSEGFPALKRILKEGREFGVGTILSTQFLQHFGSGLDDYSRYILTWVVHNVSDLKRSDVDFVFKTDADKSETERLFNQTKALEKHNSIVKIGNAAPVYMEDKAFWSLSKDYGESYLTVMDEKPEVSNSITYSEE